MTSVIFQTQIHINLSFSFLWHFDKPFFFRSAAATQFAPSPGPDAPTSSTAPAPAPPQPTPRSSSQSDQSGSASTSSAPSTNSTSTSTPNKTMTAPRMDNLSPGPGPSSSGAIFGSTPTREESTGDTVNEASSESPNSQLDDERNIVRQRRLERWYFGFFGVGVYRDS